LYAIGGINNSGYLDLNEEFSPSLDISEDNYINLSKKENSKLYSISGRRIEIKKRGIYFLKSGYKSKKIIVIK
ncbi:MAG: hypothetical protein ABIM98_08500, partial [candidate division WOR-3 bacterium]